MTTKCLPSVYSTYDKSAIRDAFSNFIAFLRAKVEEKPSFGADVVGCSATELFTCVSIFFAPTKIAKMSKMGLQQRNLQLMRGRTLNSINAWMSNGNAWFEWSKRRQMLTMRTTERRADGRL
uniref:Uncharacterized protein n=1 Tax=Globodera rostochiensis TaxID=31243 RepID=A0A914IAK1_GLORO